MHTAYISTHVGVKALTEDLDSVAVKWYNLGLQLGIQLEDLDAIAGDSDWTLVCFRKALNAWLKSGNPTHDAVIEALESSTVGHNALARELKTGGTQLSCLSKSLLFTNNSTLKN